VQDVLLVDLDKTAPMPMDGNVTQENSEPPTTSEAGSTAVIPATATAESSAPAGPAPAIGSPEHSSADEDEAFPLEALPTIPRALAQTIARAYAVPATLAAIATLGVASRAVLGLTVNGISQLKTPANLYLIVGAPAGQGKSTSFAPVVKPLRQVQARIREDLNPDSERPSALPPQPASTVYYALDGHRCLTPDWGGAPQPVVPPPPTIPPMNLETAAEYWLEGAQLPIDHQSPPGWPCLLTEDFTPLALIRLLRENNEFIGIMSSDARDVINRLRASSNLPGLTCLGLLLKCFSGDSATSHRQDSSVELEHPLATLLLMTQPGVLHEMIEDREIASQGLLSRCLVAEVAPDHDPTAEGTGELETAAVEAWDNLVFNLAGTYMDQRRFACELSPEAIQVLRECRRKSKSRQASTDRDVQDLVTRSAELATRLALVLHCMTHGPDSHENQVSAHDATSAVRIVDWFIGQMLQLKSHSRMQEREKRKRKILTLLAKKPGQSVRDLRLAHVGTTNDQVQQALEELVAEGQLCSTTTRPPTGGRAKTCYRLQPDLSGGQA
jgi:hypothetical protein